MKFRISLIAGLLASFALLPQARAELVLENNNINQSGDDSDYVDERGSDREVLRGTLQSSERYRDPHHGQQQDQGLVLPRHLPSGGNTSIIQVQPQVQSQSGAEAAAVSDSAASNRTELMRRQRVREEIRNEDMLQERLESLRLRDEQRRSGDLLGTSSAAAAASASSFSQGPRDEYVGGTAVAAASASAGASSSRDTVVVTQSVQSYADDYEDYDRTLFSIMPRGGASQLTSNDGYNIKPHYSLGVGLEVGSYSSPITFELGYTYSEYGLSLSDSNPYTRLVRGNPGRYGSQANFETVALRQNIVDGGIKLRLVGADARFRPFVGGGGAYGKSFVNYSDRVLQSMDPMSLELYGRDFEISSFLGYLSTGFDVRVAQDISVGALFKYYRVLSSQSNQRFNNQAMVGPGPGGPGGGPGAMPGMMPPPHYLGHGSTDQDKEAAAGTFSESSFYSILAGVSFSF